MKNLFIGVAAGFIVIGLIIVFISYQSNVNSLPIAVSQNQVLQKEMVEQQQLPVAQHTIDYTLLNNQLQMTFNKGKEWIEVPIASEKLFGGEFNGNRLALIEDSYILTKKRVAFLYTDGNNSEGNRIALMYTLDQGKTWKDATVTEQYPAMRFRKVHFLSDAFGYIVVSGGRTMSEELSSIFLTYDGGKSWREINRPDNTRLISDGGFIDKETGFLSFGTINPQEPDFYVTQNAGDSWRKAKIDMPVKYKGIFVTAEIPFQETDHLAVLINQGPNGDYLGGGVKGKFISKDNGLTWGFEKEE